MQSGIRTTGPLSTGATKKFVVLFRFFFLDDVLRVNPAMAIYLSHADESEDVREPDFIIGFRNGVLLSLPLWGLLALAFVAPQVAGGILLVIVGVLAATSGKWWRL